MVHKECGSAAVGLLIIGFFLTAVASLVAVRISGELDKDMTYVRDVQLRQLCASYMQSIAVGELPAGTGTSVKVVLQPGNAAAEVSSKTEYRADNLLRYVTVTASTAGSDDNARLRQLCFSFSEANKGFAASQMLTSGREIIGAENISDGALYAGNQEVVLPRADTLQGWAVNELPAEDLKLLGLNSRMYYLKSSSDFKIASSLKVYGDAVIATEGNIIISKNAKFYGRVIFLTTRNITVESGAVLPKAALLAHGKVTIAEGVSLGGIVIAKGNIELKGSASLTHDASVVAPFASAYYII